MADPNTPIDETTHKGESEQEHTIDINSMRQYILMGIDADGKPVALNSPNVTVTDMGRYLGQLQTTLLIQTATIGALQARQVAAQQSQHGKIVTPGSFRST